MRLARFVADGKTRIGFVTGDQIAELKGSWNEILSNFADGSSWIAPVTSGSQWPIAECELLAPLDSDSRGVICIGFNYREHAKEVGAQLGNRPAPRPSIFQKLASSMLAPGKPLHLDPGLSGEVDWEVELGVVIGKGGRHIPAEQVADHIAGYTIVVDVTARDLQRDHVQWFMGKNLHRSSPIGPWVTTMDEIGFPPVLQISLHVNDVEKQRSTTDRMIWGIDEFISMTSSCVELQPGDVFATGSPPGVGFSRQPPEYLRPGDLLRAEIQHLGRLEHDVQ